MCVPGVWRFAASLLTSGEQWMIIYRSTQVIFPGNQCLPPFWCLIIVIQFSVTLKSRKYNLTFFSEAGHYGNTVTMAMQLWIFQPHIAKNISLKTFPHSQSCTSNLQRLGGQATKIVKNDGRNMLSKAFESRLQAGAL